MSNFSATTMGVTLALLLGTASVAMADGMSAGTVRSAPTAPVITQDGKLLADFGGREGLVRIMDDFMVNLLADSRTRPFFEASDQTRVKLLLVEQFCVILNGPCTYSGRDMKETHAGMGVTKESFYALVEALQLAMNKHKVPFGSQNKLLAALAPQHRDIVAQ